MRVIGGIAVLVCALLGGCMNITTSIQPENTAVREIWEASDCVPIILGLAYGTATVEGALAEQMVTKIRRVQLHDYHFLVAGARCVEVVGE